MQTLAGMARSALRGRAFLPIALAALAASCATPHHNGSLGDVYRETVKIPKDLLERPGKVMMEGTRFRWEEDLPQYRIMTPEKGQFTLHVLTRWWSSEYCECWLMLEFLKDPEYDSGRMSSVLRVYGESRMPDEGLREKALRILHEGDYMEGLPATSIDYEEDGRICVSEVNYIADFGTYTNDETTAAAHQFVDLWTHDTWGGLKWFRAGKRECQDIRRYGHTLVFAENVPIRGVLYGALDASSSMQSWQAELRLLNRGTLSREQMEAIEGTENVLPAELALWEGIRQHEMKREEPHWRPRLGQRVGNLPPDRWGLQ